MREEEGRRGMIGHQQRGRLVPVKTSTPIGLHSWAAVAVAMSEVYYATINRVQALQRPHFSGSQLMLLMLVAALVNGELLLQIPVHDTQLSLTIRTSGRTSQ